MHKRVVLIGNGPIAPDAMARLVPSDFVIRFNDCRNFDQARAHTDVVAVCNTGRPARAMALSAGWRSHRAVRDAREIWSVRPPLLFADRREGIIRDHPELTDFCDNYTWRFIAFSRATGRRHRTITADVHEGVDEALRAFDPGAYVTASSGLIVMEHVLRHHHGAMVLLAGFSHTGWSGHPFEAERALVARYIGQGRVGRL